MVCVSHGNWRSISKKCPLTSEFLKTNFDGAMFGESEKARIGVVIRNFEGEVMAVLSEKIKKSPIVEILELLVAKRVVNNTLETGFNKSVTKGDSKSVINSLRHGCMENSQGGHLIKDISAIVNSF